MYSEQDLDAAVTAGAISPEAALALRNHVAAGRMTPAVDEEHFRLLTGFNDIFVAIAAVILLIAVGWIGQSIRLIDDFYAPSPFAGLFVAATAWGLAEFFTRKRRMALPSIILLLAFISGVFGAAGGAVALVVEPDFIDQNEEVGGALLAGCAALAAGAAWLHWRRFRVPITIAAGAAALTGMGLGIVAWIVGDSEMLGDTMLAFALAAGVAVFLFAMWWDSSDPRRETRRSDVAFWLHLLSAPLLVHPIFSLLGLTDGDATVPEAVGGLVVYVLLGLAALAIDRRALLVSALAYVLWALIDLFERFGAVELNFAFAAFVIGSALLLLSAFWHNARRAIVTRLPAKLKAKLPGIDRTLAPQPSA